MEAMGFFNGELDSCGNKIERPTRPPATATEAEWMEFYKDHTFDQLLRRVAELECLKNSLTERLNPRGRW